MLARIKKLKHDKLESNIKNEILKPVGTLQTTLDVLTFNCQNDLLKFWGVVFIN